MFGPSKDVLKEMLVDSWNLLARARGEKVNFISIKSGLDWIVVIHNKLDDNAQDILVALLDSEAEGKRFLAYAREQPDMLRLWRVHKSLGPYVRGTNQNIGHFTYDMWLEHLYRT